MALKLALAVAAVAVVVAVVAVFALSGSGNGDGDTAVASPTAVVTATVPGTIVTSVAPSATPTLETPPDATETPVPGAEEQARSFELIEAPSGLLEFVTDGPYVVPGDAMGAFYVNVETQDIEGWYALIEGTQFIAFSGEGRFTLFWRKNQALQGGTVYPAGFYLADRGTQKVYRWEGDAEPAFEKTASDDEIAARGDLVLFRIPDDDNASWFSLVNVATGEVETAFAAAAQWAFISGDASRIALAGQDVIVADVSSGLLERVADDALPELIGPVNYFEPGKWAGVEFVETADGESFVMTANDSDPGSEGAWWRFEWAGGLIGEGSGAKAYVSPDGELVAVAETIAETDINVGYHTFTAYRTEDGEAVFRVVGADEGYAWREHDRWLADGSGVVVQFPGSPVYLAMRDGSFRDFVGVPSPDDADIFASNRVSALVVVGSDNTPLITLSFQGGVQDFVDPWGDGGDEVRMLIPHAGHGGEPAMATIVEPYIEQAPFEDDAALQLSEVAIAFGLLDLFDEPAGDTVVGQVLEPHRVVVHELKRVCTGDGYSDPENCPRSDSTLPYEFMALVLGAELGPETGLISFWGRVTTEDGQEGWMLLQTQPQGH